MRTSVVWGGVLATAMLIASMVLGIGSTVAVVPGANGKIAYVGFDGETGETDIYTMNPDGSEVTRVTTDGQSKGTPQWSPDGTRIAFESSAISDAGSCCSLNIYTINADGTDQRRLTDTLDTNVGRNFGATWSPDGAWLAFVSTRDESREFEGDAEIYRMNADGTAPTQLTVTDYRTSDEEPSVSPDGSRIAFASNRGDTDFGTFDIYVMNADGSAVTRLTTDGAYAFPTPFESRQPTWSPDGTRIAFESTRNGNHEIWVMDADGSDPVNVSDHPSYDADPTWSPDGTQLLFTSLRDGQYDVWAVDAPAPAATAGQSLLTILGPARALAASAPRNLTAATGLDAQSPTWQRLPASSDVSEVTIDIQPGNSRNQIVRHRSGAIPVAILSTVTFDATTVAVSTVCFGDAEDAGERDCTEAHSKGHQKDINGDALVDLVLHFETKQTGIDRGDTAACLTGETSDGVQIAGCDTVIVK